ncbi:putative acyl-CoA transferase/carnitine dehydratase [Cupriavidus necator]|uniref:CoA transferase n=1 Tax=Cupriavidus necator (strain ATCC 17699 / DSM 428 / KCTC 22496 / NCIMB 10442 / H16 / Stanier 337) TaxID=381666 RepID=Q0K0F2_CUPNH|nr:CaiB/BaiF CoA-transferase family protein [Cupriavidus necator]QCC04354.1 CoA transferase [Cupriavidus necator H16]QQB79042.1 CoA transferase [Cupriavidus necator]WKA43263.1 CaiB/BaiF CoA-transferase family protein [Cupriavidus necator]CAJ96522.1 predicted acyl-CoA transferase/carnitine dehydratase [Cupriavidus necator H16]
MSASNRQGPLERFRVLDLTRLRAGPTAVRQLADWGADVIKIESPQALDVSDGWIGDRLGSDFQNLHRNKRSITLNLKDPEGVRILQRLVEAADVLVENFRPGVKTRLGVDYETLQRSNPGLVYASISGFGQDGPYADRPGYDQIVQGMGGLMAITGEKGQPPLRTGISLADTGVGLYAALGIMTALLEREVSGRGQWVQTSLLQGMIALTDYQAARWLMDGEVPEPAGNDHPTATPTGVFPTADGHINIATAGEEMWRRLCNAIGAPELLGRVEYASNELRTKNREALKGELAQYTRRKTSSEWIRAFEQASVACGPIYRMDEVFEDRQTQHLGMAISLRHPELQEIKVVAQPYTLSRTPSQMRTATPGRGEHTEAVLMELGYSAEQISDLRERHVV